MLIVLVVIVIFGIYFCIGFSGVGYGGFWWCMGNLVLGGRCFNYYVFFLFMAKFLKLIN
uniref:Uncharacterized protein n=1 Tax=Arsenophonus nasoniae TaxID=638 RepID=D2TXT3_9GAMM|nr:hypothetical protein ARN_09180 [Arsenophonus nasoniae]